MDIRNAATVLNQAAENFTTGYDGKMLDPRVVFLPCMGKLNPALDCVWQVAITSPKYQRMPDWVPHEREVKTTLCIIKALRHQIITGTFRFMDINTPGNLQDMEVTTKIFESIVNSTKASGTEDYPNLSPEDRECLLIAFDSAIRLIKMVMTLFTYKR